MFHVPAHRSLSASQRPINVKAKVDCHRCGGWPELDESGRPYSCYCCFDSGYVPLDMAFEEYAEGALYRYQADCKQLEYAERLAARKHQLAGAAARYAAQCEESFYEDIPF